MYNDILYTVNKKYRDIFLASLYSLLENGNLSNVRIHLVTDGFTKEDFDKVDRVISMFPGTLINYYNLNCMNIEALNIPNWRGSQIANARLFIDSILDLHDVYNLLYIVIQMEKYILKKIYATYLRCTIAKKMAKSINTLSKM